ncbi:hypothetical protein RISK_003011 [Rhodopirellula islandica]|uniref:Uncharacterized protein n=1 Tax=Rhodopirellula islandica TaxID=595434 RepID=A0A0J1BDP7_RHOIS|nr:hypothetical protein RISK_003011 [Rhodopirellula islandica]
MRSGIRCLTMLTFRRLRSSKPKLTVVLLHTMQIHRLPYRTTK